MSKEKMFELMNQNMGLQLATVDENGLPHTRGMMLYSADESGIVFHTGDHKDVYRQLLHQPTVEVSFMDPTSFTQVRVQGTVREIDDGSFREKIVATPGREFLKPWVAQKGIDLIRVFKMEQCTASIWTMADNFTYPRPTLTFGTSG